MIETTFGEVGIGDAFWANEGESCIGLCRIKLAHGQAKWADGCSMSCRIRSGNETVYIKEKPMTDKEQAQKEIDAIKEKLKSLEAIVNKPDRIKVPDCIDIQANGTELRILFNDRHQTLGHYYGKYHVQVNSQRYCSCDDLYLEPCKREDLKPGDVAYMSSYSDGAGFTGKVQYHCILDEKRYAYISSDKHTSVTAASYDYCWKVVK